MWNACVSAAHGDHTAAYSASLDKATSPFANAHDRNPTLFCSTNRLTVGMYYPQLQNYLNASFSRSQIMVVGKTTVCCVVCVW